MIPKISNAKRTSSHRKERRRLLRILVNVKFPQVWPAENDIHFAVSSSPLSRLLNSLSESSPDILESRRTKGRKRNRKTQFRSVLIIYLYRVIQIDSSREDGLRNVLVASVLGPDCQFTAADLRFAHGENLCDVWMGVQEAGEGSSCLPLQACRQQG